MQPGITTMSSIQKIVATLLVSGAVVGFLITPTGFLAILLIQVLLAGFLFILFRLFQRSKRDWRFRLASGRLNSINVMAFVLYLACTLGLVAVVKEIVNIGIDSDTLGGDGAAGMNLVLSFFGLTFISSALLVVVAQGLRPIVKH